MTRVVRALLVWVMVIAMPLQGLAASAMLLCGPGHDRAGLTHEVQAHDHGHGHGGDPAHAEVSADPDADSAEGRSPHHGQHTCSVCASCCAAFALPAAFVLPGVASLAQAVHASLDAPVASPPLDGLDRPPRTDLA